ncbi:pirin family protein [Phenylobacterium sp.]|uniref:pirin family protein n=1 Tax=Phenylobacterium sp. TaxID=1871053 RepID=UPI002C997601|nr:pirin family protein [Phenylobacterium sp.]HLZ74780.1 pirin family protein [Phenylobacterium sp.]
MIERRPFSALLSSDHGWLKAKHHFSFTDPAAGWGALRIWNDDVIAPGSGFPPHPHADMEIVTYVRQGAISHRDTLGNAGRTAAGDVQVMSAGSGIRHSEFNREPGETHLFQIWIVPEASGGSPAWGTKPFPKADRSGRWVVLASGFETDTEALPIRARARVLGAALRRGEALDYAADAGRRLYLAAAAGVLSVNNVRLEARDGAAIRDEPRLTFTAIEDCEIVLVDAPPARTLAQAKAA